MTLAGSLIQRILPFAKKRRVGPFTFLDHFGPAPFNPSHHMDVFAHPHIGLSTLTYLFDGHGEHRDSLGHVQNILPGDVNWMTAGKGISHVERTPSPTLPQEGLMHGLQFWVALPEEREDMDPLFVHIDKQKIPRLQQGGLNISVVVGEAFGKKSPVPMESPTIFLSMTAGHDETFRYSSEKFETALYVISGEARIDGQDYSNKMVVFEIGAELEVEIKKGSLCVLIGGEPFSTERHIWWNFVSSSKEKIEKAKAAWENQSFPQVPGEEIRIPLPSY